MKAFSPKILRTFLVGLISSSFGLSVAHAACSVEGLEGRWTYAEHGTHVHRGMLPFSEVGWFRLRKNGTGIGEAFISLAGNPLPPTGSVGDPITPGIPLNILEVKVDSRTCKGRGAFDPGDGMVRTILFVLNEEMDEFQFISTTGDITAIGTAKKDR